MNFAKSIQKRTLNSSVSQESARGISMRLLECVTGISTLPSLSDEPARTEGAEVLMALAESLEEGLYCGFGSQVSVEEGK
jgi:hypothetical protein